MMISVRVGVTLTSTPEYPSSASSRVKNSLSSALKTPSATSFRFFETCTAMVNNEKKEKEAFNTNVVTSFTLEMNLGTLGTETLHNQISATITLYVVL